jgi:hypothetical protein
LSFGGHASQHVQTFAPSTSAEAGSPIAPSLSVVTGQIFCSSTV